MPPWSTSPPMETAPEENEPNPPPMPDQYPGIQVKRSSLLFLAGLLLIACLGKETERNPLREKIFFDLRDYFNTEADRLQQKSGNFRKISYFNQRTENLSIDSIDWHKELEIFARCDINKPAWKEKYRIDSLLENGQLIELSYTAKDSLLLIKKINIKLSKQGAVREIQISKASRTHLMDMRQSLRYNPKTGYKVEQWEKVAGFAPSHASIELLFTEN